MENAVVVLTYKSAATIIEDRGSQSWRAVKRRLEQSKYIVCARNQYGPYKPEGDEPHRHAFLIGRVSTVVPDDGEGERWKIMFSEYALIEGPEMPLRGAYPVQYFDNIRDLNIDPEKLVWHKSEAKSAIERAKDMLSASYKVPREAVRIQIEM